MTARMAESLLDGSPRGIFVSIQHPNGTAYFCTGVASRTWNGQTWTATGTLGGITPVKHTSDVAIQDITFSLSGVDPNVLLGLSDMVRNLEGEAWLFCTGSDDSVVLDPYQLIDSELDTQGFVIGADGTATINIVAHSGFYTLARSIDEAWTPENEKLTIPLDTGLDMIPGLQNQNIQWTPV